MRAKKSFTLVELPAVRKRASSPERSRRAFTLIELLVVIAIIGIIAVFITISVRSSQSRARDAKRVSDLEALNSAIQMYYRETGHFPDLPVGCANGKSSNQVSAEASGACFTPNFIVGLAPEYIPALPQDPGPALLSQGLNTRGFVYFHYVQDMQLECYKILAVRPENAGNSEYKSIWDPARDGGSDNNSVDGSNVTAWSHYSRGCATK